MTENPFSLAGRVVLVTGASSGIGRSVAVRASFMGARVVALGRSEEKLDDTLSLMAPGAHRSLSLDLKDLDSIEPAIASLCGEIGPIGGLAHSAGATETALLRDFSPARAEDMMKLNWLSFLSLSKAVCRRGRYAPGLSVVALASMSAVVGQAGLSVYAGSKGALLSAVPALASEYAPRGIRFNCVSPCPVDTPMQWATREALGEEWYQKEVLEKTKLAPLKPEDVADPILFLLSDASRSVTGTNLIVDGGWSLF